MVTLTNIKKLVKRLKLLDFYVFFLSAPKDEIHYCRYNEKERINKMSVLINKETENEF